MKNITYWMKNLDQIEMHEIWRQTSNGKIME